MTESGAIHSESSELPQGTETVAMFSGPFAVVQAGEREWRAIVDFIKELKGETVVETTAIEFRDRAKHYNPGDIVVVDVGTANSLLSIVNPLRDLESRAGINTTVLLHISDDERQKEILEDEQWPRDIIPRYNIGRLPDWPEE